MLGYALTLGDDRTWSAIAPVWEARLTVAERYDLARSVMLALSPSDNEALLQDVIGSAGFPLAPFNDPLPDAQMWAECANPEEKRAYCLAAFMAMSARDRRDFLETVKEVAA